MEFYEGFRPPYSNKLYEIVYEANAKSINQWGTALDPGTGPGMVAHELSKKFSKVVGVDSNDRYIEVAKESSKGYDNIEYDTLKAEKLCSVFPDKSFDLIVISEAAHWFGEQAMEEVGRVLKPNGILVMWIYVLRYFPDNAIATDHYMGLMVDYLRLYPYNEVMDAIFQRIASGLDRVKIPSQYFAPGTRRIRYNYAHPISFHDIYPSKIDLGVSILPTDRVEFITDDDFFTVTKNWEWIKGFIDNLIPLEHLDLHELLSKSIKLLETFWVMEKSKCVGQLTSLVQPKRVNRNYKSIEFQMNIDHLFSLVIIINVFSPKKK